MDPEALANLENDEERHALEAAQGGDRELLGQVLGGYSERLRHMLRLRISPQLAKRVGVSDVLQDALVEVTQRLPKYLEERRQVEGRGGMPFFLWVRFLTGQQLLKANRFHLGTPKRDAYRDQPLVAPQVPGASSACLAIAIADSGISPSGFASQREAHGILAEALEALTEEEREVLMMRHFEHLSNREIAHILGMSDPGASLRYLRALRRIQTILARKGLEFPE